MCSAGTEGYNEEYNWKGTWDIPAIDDKSDNGNHPPPASSKYATSKDTEHDLDGDTKMVFESERDGDIDVDEMREKSVDSAIGTSDRDRTPGFTENEGTFSFSHI